ncbi:Virulence plasmid integrase pGP8-D [Chlamydiales bacterium SCGC AG-110-P3]|nr:Virulence plasmid integrase pGP8-D [Chlamydiales bacterium SCGC AG-110-P3]
MTSEITKYGSAQPISHAKAIELKTDAVWESLSKVSVEHAVLQWLDTFDEITQLNYSSGVKRLAELGLLEPSMNLQQFSLVNHSTIVDKIKLVPEWAEATKQARAACYISLTGFLDRRTEGLVKKATPSREGNSKTFFRVREKVSTNAMTRAQWIEFFIHLERLNPRDELAGKVMLQGGKRVSEVLQITSEDILWEKRQIQFAQAKTKGYEKYTVITYSERIMERIQSSLEGRQGHIFVTRTGAPVQRIQLARNFRKAGEIAGIPFRITPHVLRASAVTYLKNQGFPDSDIMKVTGHASAEMIHAYDKSSRDDNLSQKVNLVE